MAITTTTHLNFHGDARAALEFYQGVFGGRLSLTTYGEVGMPESAPGANDVVFGLVATQSGFRIMAYDIPGSRDSQAASAGTTRRENGMTFTDQPFFVSVSGETFDEVRVHWDRLAEGSTIVESLAASAWSAGFGMLTDRFGVTWTFGVVPAASE